MSNLPFKDRKDDVISSAEAAAIIAVHHADKQPTFVPDNDHQRREYREHVGRLRRAKVAARRPQPAPSGPAPRAGQRSREQRPTRRTSSSSRTSSADPGDPDGGPSSQFALWDEVVPDSEDRTARGAAAKLPQVVVNLLDLLRVRH
jgi:hypothetical protein